MFIKNKYNKFYMLKTYLEDLNKNGNLNDDMLHIYLDIVDLGLTNTYKLDQIESLIRRWKNGD